MKAVKTKSYIFLMTLLITLILASCEKEKDYTTVVNGKVFTQGSNTPIHGALVKLYTKPTCFLCSSEMIASTSSDPQGNYSFHFTFQKGAHYFVVFTHDNYFPIENNSEIKPGSNTIDQSMRPYAWIKCHIQNSNPINSGDQIITNLGAGLSYTGNVNTTVVSMVQANQLNTITWHVIKTNIDTIYSTQIYCPALDTVSLTISY